MRLVVDKFKKTFQTERFIAEKSNKIHFHDKNINTTVAVVQTSFFKKKFP